jgi:RsiW-degrading membrane proteinase PrsW (M82 family)
MTATPPAPPVPPRVQLTRSMIFPLVGGRSTWSHEHLLPIFATVVAGIALLAVPLPAFKFNANPEINEAWQVYLVVAIYITFLVNYYINQMCGRAKPGWMLAIVALFTFVMLGSRYWNGWYYLFYDVIPAEHWQKSSSVIVRLFGWWFGTGLCEEGFKAWPLILLIFVGAGYGYAARRNKGAIRAHFESMRHHVGLSEPLDGIVLGVASGSGFFIAETLGQYVPNAMKGAGAGGSQAFEGLVLLLGRGLPDVAEHSAWAGLFGYFIGLAVLRPGMAIFLVPFGWLSAAALHAGWDGISDVTNSDIAIMVFLVFVGVLSYALLAGAIFQARAISPRLALVAGAAAEPGAAGDAPAHSSAVGVGGA